MSFFEAIILGIVQGLTEFLPVSSSGHLSIGKEIFNINSDNLVFEITVHAATVMSTIVVFRKEIVSLLNGLFKIRYNDETKFVLKILISMFPVLIVGLFFKDFIERIFGSGILITGIALLLTSALLLLARFVKTKARELGYREALIIGIAQAFAVLPGLSRSGSTISAGVLLGVKREEVARFSFLMVLVPILGEAFLELVSGEFSSSASGISTISLMAGFSAAFLSGLFACKTMIALVKRLKLTGFAIYCALLGVFIIVRSIL
jgi:undecaprenyl-diphosphatase